MAAGPFRPEPALATVDKVTVVTGLFRRARTQTVARRGGPRSCRRSSSRARWRPHRRLASPGTVELRRPAARRRRAQPSTPPRRRSTRSRRSSPRNNSRWHSCPSSTTRPLSTSSRSTRSCRPPTRASPSPGRSTPRPTTRSQVAAVNAYIYDTPSGQLTLDVLDAVGHHRAPRRVPADGDRQHRQCGDDNSRSSERQLSATESALARPTTAGSGRVDTGRHRTARGRRPPPTPPRRPSRR